MITIRIKWSNTYLYRGGGQGEIPRLGTVPRYSVKVILMEY